MSTRTSSIKKIFVGPVEVAGYYENLAYGLRELGYDVKFVTFRDHPFSYKINEKRHPLLRAGSHLSSKRTSAKNKLWSLVLGLIAELLRVLWSLPVLFRFDVFVFGFGVSLWKSGLDLPILKLLGKAVIMNISHGSEARPAYMDGARFGADGLGPKPISIFIVCTLQNWRIRLIERFASFVIGAPFSSSPFMRKPFLNSMIFGLPQTQPSAEPGPNDTPRKQDKNVRALHAPSHRFAKGSSVIERTVGKLGATGHHFELIELHGVSNSVVQSVIKHCDFVIDQVYSDLPMAGFAVEAAWNSKPAIVAGYGLDYLRLFCPDNLWPPTLICKPEQLEEAVLRLVCDEPYRLKLGLEAKKFVEENWNSTAVARRYERLFRGEVPDSWYLDPFSVSYIFGAGLSVNNLRRSVADFIERFGRRSLYLNHRHDLLVSLDDLISGHTDSR